MLDGTKAYLHAVIDNYSRKILAWTVSDTMSPSSTYRVLVEAAKQLPGVTTNVIMDSGSENLNRIVDPLFDGEKMTRILALVDVSYSNSMIEAWWRSLRHQWLYLHHFDTIATVRRLTAFYVHEHNTVMPHTAFEGQTPDEVYFGRGERVPDEAIGLRSRPCFKCGGQVRNARLRSCDIGDEGSSQTAAVVYGCFADDGTFTESPLAPL